MIRWFSMETSSSFCSHRRLNGFIRCPKIATHRAKVCAMLLFLTLVVQDVAADGGRAAYCPSYCSTSNDYHSGFYCNTSPRIYCCGDRNTRSCCDNESLSIEDEYPDVCYFCTSSPCGFLNEWSTILMSMAVVLMAGLVIAVCCHCYAVGSDKSLCKFAKCCRARSSSTSPSDDGDRAESRDSSQSNRRTRRRRRVDVESVEVPNASGDFNPDHPFAFHPPEYDELSITISEPPKYDDIEMTSSRTDNNDCSATNAAFEPEENGSLTGVETSPRRADSRIHAPTVEAGDGRVVRVDVRPLATENNDVSPSPPAYEDTVSNAPLYSHDAAL